MNFVHSYLTLCTFGLDESAYILIVLLGFFTIITRNVRESQNLSTRNSKIYCYSYALIKSKASTTLQRAKYAFVLIQCDA